MKIYRKKYILRFLIILISTILFITAAKDSYADLYFKMEPDIQTFSSKSLNKESNFLAYHENFKGGVNIAVGDIDGDNIDEIITGAGLGGGPHIRIFDKFGREKSNFFAFHPDFHGGVDVACGDIDNDGRDDLIVSQKSKGQAWIKVYKFENFREYVYANFLGYAEGFKGGAHVASGDIDRDGRDEIITGAGLGGGPHVRAFEPNGKPININFFPYPLDYRGGVDVASGDVDGDDFDEIITSANRLATARIKIYKPNGNIIGNFIAFEEAFQGGVNIYAGDYDRDGRDDVLAAPNVGGGPNLRVFDYTGSVILNSYMAYPGDFRGGVGIAIGNLDGDLEAEIVTSPLSGIDNEKRIIGFSAQGRPIEAYYFGNGYQKTIFVGGTHAGTERNTVALMNLWIEYLKNHPLVVPSSCQVVVVPNHNPDGYASFSRYNTNGVDLNRNFATNDWGPISYLWSRVVNAGSYPFSEPENIVLRNLIESENFNKLISYHSAANKVFASEISDNALYRPSLDFARFYNSYAGYNVDDNFVWEYYPISGDLSSWVSQSQGIPALTIELSNGVSTDWDKNLPAMIASILY